VILAAKGEIRHMMEEADGALIIDPENVDQMQAAIELVMDEPEAAARRARAGRNWVEKGFNRNVLARRMARFLERVLADSRTH
jgi:glycosyltransferase involved in cell wall biosynthesis